MNCPELVKEFEDNLKKKTATATEKKTSKGEPKTKRRATSRSKRAKMNDSDRSEEDPSLSLDNDTQTDQPQQNDHELDDELHSPSPILNGDPLPVDAPAKSPAQPSCECPPVLRNERNTVSVVGAQVDTHKKVVRAT